MPTMLPPENAVSRAEPASFVAAKVVRPFALVAMYIPMYPAEALQSAPSTKAKADPNPSIHHSSRATTPTKGASQVYSFLRNAMAPL